MGLNTVHPKDEPTDANQIKSMTSMIIVASTSRVSRPLSIMNFECNLI